MNQDFAQALSIFKPGIDFSTGKRDVNPYEDQLKAGIFDPSVFLSGKGASALEDKIEKDRYTSNYGANLPALNEEWAQKVAANVALNKALQPMALDQARKAAELQAYLSDQQIRQLIPAAQAISSYNLAQNLAASKDFASFMKRPEAEGQNIMSSKQGQMFSAASGEATRAQAMAAQQDAAKRFAGSFAGKYISVA